MAKIIVFTGGGSAGHVTPNIALIEKCRAESWNIAYIGSMGGIEQELITQLGMPYYAVATGKMRRYWSWQNFIDPFKVFWGFIQAIVLLRKIKPDIVFSKGGFVAVPVVVAAWLIRILVVAHESDLTPGLANRLCLPFVKRVCISFPDGERYFKHSNKCVLTGSPVRHTLLNGDAERGRKLCLLSEGQKVILVMGGGQGAQRINEVVRGALPALNDEYAVVHLCGKGKLASQLVGQRNYVQFEYLHEELADVFACADIVVSRAGANSLFELIALQKPHILIPLPHRASRGDQIANACYFADKGMSYMIPEEALNEERLVEAIKELNDNAHQFKSAMADNRFENGLERIFDVIHTVGT